MRTALRALALLLLLCVLPPAHAQPEAATAWRLLDYVSVDYASAVHDGEVVSATEYAEMQEFAGAVRTRIAALPETQARPGLVRGAEGVEAAIQRKAEPAVVAQLARALAGELLAAYPMPLAPRTAPDVQRGALLYQQQCAACHGATGAGDGPAAATLDPPPIDFTDATRARQRSLFALYQVIGQGLEGTSMASYAALPSDDRWALAFHIGQYAFDSSQANQGQRLWNQDQALRARVPSLQALTQVTPAALAADLGADDADAVTAWLRGHPDAVQGAPEGSLALARARLADSLQAYEAGDQGAARNLALSAYLDGFEPVESLLGARDAELMVGIEGAMAQLRSRIEQRAPVASVRQQVDVVDTLFGRAEAALAPKQSNTVSTFLGAFTILLREGVEALLVLIAMIAFLRKAGRTEVMPYVHAGWIGALLAGVLTWGVATYLVSISGASRELTEGFAALFAAAVLLVVGVWMHGKSQAGAWQRYIRGKLSHALSKGSAWFLCLLAFVVVYREVFETVLFFAALWSQGNAGAILAGAGAGVVALGAIAWGLLRYSMRLPIAQFFAWSSVLISVLAVVLAGKGIAALQEAGWLSVQQIAFPRMTPLGIYPTLQGVAVQVLVLAVILLGFWLNRRAARLAMPAH